jgi:hypothetical protein
MCIRRLLVLCHASIFTPWPLCLFRRALIVVRMERSGHRDLRWHSPRIALRSIRATGPRDFGTRRFSCDKTLAVITFQGE